MTVLYSGIKMRVPPGTLLQFWRTRRCGAFKNRTGMNRIVPFHPFLQPKRWYHTPSPAHRAKGVPLDGRAALPQAASVSEGEIVDGYSASASRNQDAKLRDWEGR